MDDPLQSPLKDTTDVLWGVQHMYDVHPPHAKDLVMSKFHFEAVYSYKAWQDMSKMCKQWLACYCQLFHASNFLTMEAQGCVEFISIFFRIERYEAFFRIFFFLLLALTYAILRRIYVTRSYDSCCFMAPGAVFSPMS